MVELVDTLDLGSINESCAGSSPVTLIGLVTQWLECWFVIPKVVGSNPIWPV